MNQNREDSGWRLVATGVRDTVFMVTGLSSGVTYTFNIIVRRSLLLFSPPFAVGPAI